MITTTQSRLTGERPREGVTPDSLLALHDAGYRAVVDRLGDGRLLDVGCGEGFESLRLAAAGRRVVGVDYSTEATAAAASRTKGRLVAACMDASTLALAPASFDWVCSSHLIEHFDQPGSHAAEVARVLAGSGSAFFLTPNGPADFENPFHVHLFDRAALRDLLGSFFDEVWVGGVDAPARVKADFAVRRAKARRILALDVFNLRHRLPRRWYVALYGRLLPIAYRLVARADTGGSTGISAEGWYVTADVDDTTLVLFAVCRRPRRVGGGGDSARDR